MQRIKNFFESEKIEFFAVLPAEAVKIVNPRRIGEIQGFESVIPFIIPYKTDVSALRNMARFAASRDYHMYAQGIFERFKSRFGDCLCFCDNSPIDEKRLAAEAGLGVIGDNSLIINKKYGSFIFIGEIFLKERFESYSPICVPERCISCGACKRACPVGLDFERCISAVNQKKHITPEEESLIRASRFKWGCDICQEACPCNKNAADTPIEFFKNDIAHTLTSDMVDEMVQNGTFSQRAYAWRGEKTIKRNLEL